MLPGAVFDVVLKRNGPEKKGTAEVKANYDLGDGVIKRACVNIHSMKAKKLNRLQCGRWGSSATACRQSKTQILKCSRSRGGSSNSSRCTFCAGRSNPLMQENCGWFSLILSNSKVAVAACHEQKWYEVSNVIVKDINGTYHYYRWSVKTPTDANANIDGSASRLDVYLMMFSSKHQTSIAPLL